MSGSESGGQNFGSGVSYNRSNFGSGDFGGDFNAGDNYRNIGGAGSSVGGNQRNNGGMGGPANQSSGFSSPQSQQQEHSNFSDHMGGVSYNRSNFGSGNFGGDFNAGDHYTNIGDAGNQNNTGGFRGQANQSSGFSSPQPQQQQQQSNVRDHMGGRGVSYNRSNFGSGDFRGSFNAGDNYWNIGGAGSSVGGNQRNTGGMGGPANQSSGFSSPQSQQQQQSHFSDHMGGRGVSYNRCNFGSGNFGGNFNAGDNYRNIGGAGSSVGGNQRNTGGMGGPVNQSSGFRRQRPQEHDSGHMGLLH